MFNDLICVDCYSSANDENALETSSSVTLAPLWVEDTIIGLEAKLPAHGWVRTPLFISYLIKNHSDYMITLRLTMEASDAFMVAGQKKVSAHFLILITCNAVISFIVCVL